MDVDFNLEHENAERILKEGWQLFQQKGYRGVTLDELCLRCGLTKPTLYYYFHDKENLFIAVLRYKLRGFHETIEQPGTLTERLERIATHVRESFETEYTALLRDREHLKKPENLRAIRDAFHSELFGPLIALMQSGLQQGELQGGSAETLALIFLGTLNNFINKAQELQMSSPELAKMLTRHFLYGAALKKTDL